MIRRFLIALAAPIALAGCATPQPASPVSVAQGGGVAAANDPRAGVVGEEIIRRGGNAADAAIAMMLALAVLEPQSSGLGGGGFLLLGAEDGSVEAIDGRETAPAAATPTWFLDPDGEVRDRREATLSGLSIGVPGVVALAAEAHARHGSLPWAQLFEPAIALAREGFRITPRLSGSLATSTGRADRDPAGAAMFYGEDGEAPPAGAVLRLPELADTLEMIAREGAASFYTGPFAQAMAAKIAADTPGDAAMTPADIAAYQAHVEEPLCGFYRLHKVCTMGPPSSGGYAVLAILAQVEPFDLAALGLRNPRTWHIVLEAQRLAYADREFYIADDEFVDVPLAGLLDPAYLARRAGLIDPDRALETAEPGRPDGAPLAQADGERWPERGTTHFVAVDGVGNMASFTATVEGAFGSGLVHSGFYLNNELTDFSFLPEEYGRPVANRVEGGKRPASSMSPTVIYDPAGEPFFTLGAAGGTLIPVQTARAIIGVIDFGLPLEDALGLPFAMSVGENTVLVEQGTWMEELGPDFERLGHDRVVPFGGLLRTTGALRTDSGWVAAFDPRLAPLVAIPEVVGEEASEEAGYAEGL